jgi:hypothetical protein
MTCFRTGSLPVQLNLPRLSSFRGSFERMDQFVSGISPWSARTPRIDRDQLDRGAHFHIEDLFGIRLRFLYS